MLWNQNNTNECYDASIEYISSSIKDNKTKRNSNGK